MKIPKLQIKLKNFQKYRKGFTLLEMLVAVAVFAAAATIGAGALLNVSDAQQKILSLRVTQDNLSYALDIMGKEIRTGYSYHCGPDIDTTPQNCPSGDSSFTFINSFGQTVTYRLNGQRLEVSKNGGENWQFLTSPDLIIIDQLSFYVVGTSVGDGFQPRVSVVLRGMAGAKEKTKSRLNIQTTVSQRMLDS